jgi:predicted ATPase
VSHPTVISGCSGSGKSTLLDELGRRGYRVYHEPGRQIVKEELALGGDALPWGDAEAFMALVVERAIDQAADAASHDEIAFCDRGMVDALNHYLRHDLPVPLRLAQSLEAYPYASRVFMSPPWPEIYQTDRERRHGFEDARDEHDRLVVTYARLGYEIVVVPKLAVPERTDFVVSRLGAPAPGRHPLK